MSKPTSRAPSGSQITFNNKDEVLTASKTKTSSKSSIKGAKKGSKSALKSKSGVATSTPNSSQRDLTLDESAIPAAADQTLKAEPGNYVPSPYTFRAPGPETTRKEVKGVPVKCPPYHLQLDHTLAVIWKLFSKEELQTPLGIVQLQWALSFLRGIYNRKGEHPKDVALCIQTIEDELIEQYADMVDEVQYIKKPTQTASKTKAKESKKPKKSSSKVSSSSGASATTPDETDQSPDQTADEQTEEEQEDAVAESACEDDTCMNKICDDYTEDKSEMVMKQVPFSINYAEMMKRSPPDVEQLFPSSKGSKVSSSVSGTKKSSSGLDTTVSRDDMVEFLKAWRREQVEKIQAELKRLKSIENFIGSAETENFSPYLDEKQLDSLVAQKIVSPKKK